MTNMIKVLSIVSILFISSGALAADKSPSRLNQIRNSLWVFGVDNQVSETPEIVEQAILGLSMGEETNSAIEQMLEVPEELEMAISKIES